MRSLVRSHIGFRVVLIAVLLAATAATALAAEVPVFTADPVDHGLAKLEDEQNARLDEPPRFAVPQETFIAPETHGLWERVAEDEMMWRLRIASPGALSLNLGFTRYGMPDGGRLRIYGTDDPSRILEYDAGDNKAHGQLWTPLLTSEELMIEATVPLKDVDRFDLLLESVNTGYREFGDLFPEKMGDCNIDVVCPEGDDWSEEIQSVAVFQRGGAWACTGAMMNNTAEDQTPYFLTADHCNVTEVSDATIVVYWNFESPVCGQLDNGSLDQNQTGSTFLVGGEATDYTLLLLDDAPDPAWEVAYAGWDNTGVDPSGAVAIHHPSTDEKCISFEYDPLTTTSYTSDPSPGDGTHFRVEDWDLGTTEHGSSGSPLFDTAHRVIGQLHGGWAACTNDLPDWYGKLSVSWSGLAEYLDPAGGAETLDTLAPYNMSLNVSSGAYDLAGDVGGPFEPASHDWVLSNLGDVPLDFSVSADVAWLDVAPASGTLPAGGNVTVTASPNAAAAALAVGSHHGEVSFVNETSHDGDAVRAVNMQVGVPQLVHGWNMDTDPGWSAEGDWAWGVPQGQGGEYGEPDPAAGHTGANVYGFALDGDYANDMPERHLTAGPIDCSQLQAVTLKFHRWLNVERSAYDHAYLRVSTDGVDWTTVWENEAAVTDDAWSQQSHDISALADGEDAVYVRWTMGTTDGSWRYSGWNLDDVEIWALQTTFGTGSGVPGRLATLGPAVPNPFNPMTTVSFELRAPARAVLAVYDLRGRRVDVLVDAELGAGRHEAVWDGLDARGAAAPSGNYLFRLEAGGEIELRKALLVR